MFFPIKLSPKKLKIKREFEDMLHFELWRFKSKLEAFLRTFVEDDHQSAALLEDTGGLAWGQPSFREKLEEKLGFLNLWRFRCAILLFKEELVKAHKRMGRRYDSRVGQI